VTGINAYDGAEQSGRFKYFQIAPSPLKRICIRVGVEFNVPPDTI